MEGKKQLTMITENTPTDFIPIKRALLSVTDKTNILEIAHCLQSFNCEIISSGGTAQVLAAAGIRTREISSITGNAEAFGGRMKTISFEIESAILFDRVRDRQEAERLRVQPIDIVICNLYDFKKYYQHHADIETLIEYIDIGGPTMIRAAAKNFKYVAVVIEPNDYGKIIRELQIHHGCLSYQTRKELMAKAFNVTADYDALIAQAMDAHCGTQSLRLNLKDGRNLRYGENPHQSAAYYRMHDNSSTLFDIQVVNGIELSYNNMLDLQSALECIKDMNRHSCVIVKHTNPCGMATGTAQRDVFELAWRGDPISAFGGIVAFNSEVSRDTVSFLGYDNSDTSKKKFIEIIAAPAFTEEALMLLKTQKKLRVVRWQPNMLEMKQEIRIANGLALVQERDDALFSKMELMTKSNCDLDMYMEIIEFGLHAVRQIKSNAIAIIHRTASGIINLIGMGSGQPNRLDSIKLAVDKAKNNLGVDSLASTNTILISDAFFPFEDNIDAIHGAGISLVVEPGGSIRDTHIIERANELDICLFFTGMRHFKH